MYEVWPVQNDPDTGPKAPAACGNWTWWRTGPHPAGQWQAMDWGGNFYEEFKANRAEFPVFQDAAHGSHGDWGHYACHACEYLGDGYPEPGHRTACDGICKRRNCVDHPSAGVPPCPQADDHDGPCDVHWALDLCKLENDRLRAELARAQGLLAAIKIPNDVPPRKNVRVFLNRNVTMTPGKAAAQAVHAALLAYGIDHGSVFVLNGGPNKVNAMDVQVRDAGLTEVDPGTLTAGASLED